MTEILWVKLTDRLDVHIGSIKSNLDVGAFASAMQDANKIPTGSGLNPKIYDIVKPHWLARRYAELAASLNTIGHEFPGSKRMK